MEENTLRRSAEIIAGRNISDRVLRVVVTFNSSKGQLRVVYCLASEPTEDDEDDCELTCAELIAEFPEIVIAETSCIPIEQYSATEDETNAVVFSRQVS